MNKKLLYSIATIILLEASFVSAGELTIEPSGYLPVKSAFDGPVNKFFVKYNIPDSLSIKLITLAFFELETDLDTSIVDAVTICVSPLIEQWTSGVSPSVDDNILKNDTLLTYLHQEPGSEEMLRFDVTIPVIDWVNGNMSNYGFVVCLRQEEDYSFNAAFRGANIAAKLKIYFENIPNDRPE